MKKTKIVCSIGPASNNSDIMLEMVKNGMNVARINFSHATLDERKEVINSVKKVREITDQNIAILYDTKGPEFRNGILENDEINLIEGNLIRIVKEKVIGNSARFSVNHPNAIDSLDVGNRILLENGLMCIEVVSKEIDGITCKVIVGGVLGNKKSLSVPGVHLDMPFVSEEDKADIIYACQNEGDFLALSFVSKKQDVLEVKEILKEQNRTDMKIIAKIESATGIDNLEEIISVADGVMVARGDLGVEVSMEDLPILQKRIIDCCRRHGKFCIVATEMLETMKKNNRPTRAEVSDVANAVLNGTDAVMLSGETTVGKYPAETVKCMSNICENIEKYLDCKINTDYIKKSVEGAIATNVVETASLLDAKLIVATTMSGKTAARVSNLRPKTLILATCPNKKVARSLALNFGVYPIVTNIFDSIDEIVEDAKIKAIDFAELKHNDLILITGGFHKNNENKGTNFMKIEKI